MAAPLALAVALGLAGTEAGADDSGKALAGASVASTLAEAEEEADAEGLTSG